MISNNTESTAISSRVLKWVGNFTTKAWPLILVLTLGITALSFRSAKELPLSTDIKSLLPPDDRTVEDFLEVSRSFGFNNKLPVLLKFAPNLNKSEIIAFLEEFSRQLKASRLIKDVDYKLSVFKFEPQAFELADKFDISERFYEDTDSNSYLFFVYPLGSNTDMKFCRELMDEVRRIENTVYRLTSLVKDKVKISYAGGYVITLYETQSMESSVKKAVISSFLGILILFFLFFRRLRSVIFSGIPLACALIWTLSLAKVVFGSLNAITAAFAAILAGLGIDFAIHIVNSFTIEYEKSSQAVSSVKIALINSGRGIFYGCLTTVIAFYALMAVDFRGVKEFGFLVGTGLIFCMLAMFVVLPALLVFGYSLPAFRQKAKKSFYFGLSFLGSFVKAYGQAITLVLLLFLTVVSYYAFSTYGFIGFDNRLDSMSVKGNPGIKAQKEILKIFGNSIEPIVLISRSDTAQGAIDLISPTVNKAKNLVDDGQLIKAENLLKYLPSYTSRQEFFSQLTGRKGARAFNYFLKKLKKDPLKQEEYQYLSERKDFFLEKAAASDYDLTYPDLKAILPANMLDKFIMKDVGREVYHAINYLYPVERITDEKKIEELKYYFGIDGSILKMSGMSLLVAKLESLSRKALSETFFIVGILLLLALFIVYRSLKVVLISLVPLLMAIIATFTAMLYLGIKFNYMNIVALPLLLGMGIDNNIHIINRYLRDKRDLVKVISETGKATLLTSMTTMAAFSTLIFTNHSGLISFGSVVFMGMGFCLIASLVVLPSLLQMIKK